MAAACQEIGKRLTQLSDSVGVRGS